VFPQDPTAYRTEDPNPRRSFPRPYGQYSHRRQPEVLYTASIHIIERPSDDHSPPAWLSTGHPKVTGEECSLERR